MFGRVISETLVEPPDSLHFAAWKTGGLETVGRILLHLRHHRFAEALQVTALHHQTIMLPASQPSRPRVCTSFQAEKSYAKQSQLHPPNHSNLLFQQQTRNTHAQAEEKAASRKPKSQIEAMPPSNASAGVPAAAQQHALPMYNPAVVHPVFFTDCWRKAPFPLPFNAGFSPVAAGYAFGDGRQRAEGMTKL